MEHAKKLLVLRQLLIGRHYHDALHAMEFARAYHVGVRKDKVTPEFDHQLSLALYALTLPNLIHPQEVIAAIFLHDVREDYDVSDLEIRRLFSDPGFTERVSVAVENLTKVERGVKKDPVALAEAQAKDPVASIVKGVDRNHNFQSMIGVFTYAKQVEYIEEAQERIIPMLKKARRNFPAQVAAYENLKFVLNSQIELIRAIHKAAGYTADVEAEEAPSYAAAMA